MVLEQPADFKLMGTPAKRLDTACEGQQKRQAIYCGIRRSAAGCCDRDAGTDGRSRRSCGRTSTMPAAKAVKGVRQVVRARRRRGGCRRPRWDCRRRAGGAGDRMRTRVAARRARRRRVVDELRKATLDSGPVAQNISDTQKAIATTATKVEATYGSVPGAREQSSRWRLHGSCPPEDGCDVSVEQPGPGASPGHCRKQLRTAVGRRS